MAYSSDELTLLLYRITKELDRLKENIDYLERERLEDDRQDRILMGRYLVAIPVTRVRQFKRFHRMQHK